MKREITVKELGSILWIVYTDSENLASSRNFDQGEERKAWREAERVAKMAGCKVAKH